MRRRGQVPRDDDDGAVGHLLPAVAGGADLLRLRHQQDRAQVLVGVAAAFRPGAPALGGGGRRAPPADVASRSSMAVVARTALTASPTLMLGSSSLPASWRKARNRWKTGSESVWPRGLRRRKSGTLSSMPVWMAAKRSTAPEWQKTHWRERNGWGVLRLGGAP